MERDIRVRERMVDKEFAPEELKNSNRIFKSATPKYTWDWYLKWVSSVFIIAAMAFRSTQMYPFIDLCLSIVGVAGWLGVSLAWKDRALIMVNAVSLIILLSGLISHVGRS